MSDSSPGPRGSAVAPSMLDLVRLSPRPLFPPGGRDLYHQIALLTGMSPGTEVLVAACGAGRTLEYFVQEFEVEGSGADDDPALIERAESRFRGAGLQDKVQLQRATTDDLPYRDGVFDVVVGELGVTASASPEDAVRELARVAKPGGFIVLIQLVWKAPVDPLRQEALPRHLGVRPLMLVELKRILRASGVRELHTEAWSDEETAFRPSVKKPFPDFAELFSVPEKVRILGRARRRWGWRGVWDAILREREVHNLLTRERILGLDMIRGRKIGDEASSDEEDRSSGQTGQWKHGKGARERERDAREAKEDARESRKEARGEKAGRGNKGRSRRTEKTTETDSDQTEDLPLFSESKRT